MDLTKTIDDLRRQKEKLEQVITSFEALQASVTLAFPQKKRRGRKFMSLAERQEVSARMKRFWEDRRQQRRPWS